MPKISLRAYNREISNLIDRGQTDEAIAHCQYILQAYPKHLESYRMLGKAYLEAHKHTEAVDIFQRVLAVVPDDFITHVGMSIIRGEENNLDGAIWHMERAFEVQLSNQAIQDELKELYGKRDGQKPAKIRITRGGLCRMYARGNQYRQAVAEIKSALQETPERADLEVILAKMYYQSGMTSDALDLCRKLLEKMPFCYEANKLMVQILKDANKAKEAEFYQKKLNALDPYEEFLTDPSATLDTIVDDSVMVEKFYYDPSEKTVQAKNRMPNKGKETEEPAPDWLVSDLSGGEDVGAKGFTRILDSTVLPNETDDGETDTSTQPVVTEPKQEEELPAWLKEEGGVTPVADASIPDFLKATGWAEAGTISEDAPPAQVINMDEEPPVSAETVPGEIPDWLRSAAPEGVTEILSPEDAPQNPDASFQDWLSTLSEEPAKEAEVPVAHELEPQSEVEPIPNETLPVEAFSAGIDVTEAQPADALPDWLSEIPTESPASGVSGDATPDWLKEESTPAELASPEITLTSSDALPDDTFPISGGTSILSPDDVPEWLQDLTPSADHGESAPQAFSTDEGAVPPVPPIAGTNEEIVTMKLTPEEKQDMPDWLAEIQQATSKVEEPPAEPVDERKTASLPDEEKEELDRQPDWLHLLDQEDTTTGKVISVTDPSLGIVSSTTTPAEFTEEEAMDGLEEKPTTSILPPNPEDQEKELPDWLKELDSTSSAEGTMPSESVPAEGEESFPDWLKGYPNAPAEAPLPPAEPTEEAIAASAQEMPDWLKDMNITGDTTGSVPEMPDWLKGAAPEVAEATQPVVRGTKTDLPSWMAPPEPVAEVPVEPVIEAPSEPASEVPMETIEELPAEKSIEDLVSDLVDEAAPPILAEGGVTSFLEMEETEGVEVPSEVEPAANIVEEVLPIVDMTEEPDAEIATEESQAEAVPSVEESEVNGEFPVSEYVVSEPEMVETEVVPEETFITTETIDFSQPSGNLEVPVEEQAEESVEEFQAEEVAEVVAELQPEELPEVLIEPVAEVPVEETYEQVPEVIEKTVAEEVTVVKPEPVIEKFVPVESVIPADLPVSSYSEADYADLFNGAVAAIHSGDMQMVSEKFTPLIRAEHRLDEVIQTLSTTAEQMPNDFMIWSLLGDAYGRSGKLQKALDAYTQAEDNLQ